MGLIPELHGSLQVNKSFPLEKVTQTVDSFCIPAHSLPVAQPWSLTSIRPAVRIFHTAGIASQPDDLTHVTIRIQETTQGLTGQYTGAKCCGCKTRNCGGKEHLQI